MQLNSDIAETPKVNNQGSTRVIISKNVDSSGKKNKVKNPDLKLDQMVSPEWSVDQNSVTETREPQPNLNGVFNIPLTNSMQKEL